MLNLVFAFGYGLLMVILVYLITYYILRGVAKKRPVPMLFMMGKYLIYWKVVEFGFSYLPASGIVLGFTTGIYTSLVFFSVRHWHKPSSSILRKLRSK